MLEHVASVAVGLVALVHLAISFVEMFLWLRPKIYGIFGFATKDEASKARPIVMNAGLYNLFIAAGLLWGAVGGPSSFPVRVFFLSCVIVAGLFGAVTLPPGRFPIRPTLLLQTAPGIVAMILVWAARPSA